MCSDRHKSYRRCEESGSARTRPVIEHLGCFGELVVVPRRTLWGPASLSTPMLGFTVKLWKGVFSIWGGAGPGQPGRWCIYWLA